MNKLRVFEAFAGVGTQSMALKRLGIPFEVVGIAEIDKFAIQSYMAIHGETNNYGDISKIDPTELPDMDLFTYSFPCQDLSISGRQRGMREGTRSGLLYECEKVISTKKPKYLLLENVKNLVGKKFKPDFDKWLEWLESQGYSNYWQVLNAKDYGVPQNRERVFVVSILGEGAYEFPEPFPLDVKLKDILEDEFDEKYYYGDMKLTNLSKQVSLGNISETDGMTCVNPRKIDGTQTYQQDRVFSPNGIYPALAANLGRFNIIEKDGEEIPQQDTLINYRIRRLTPLECWRLMGITDEDFYKAKDAGTSDSQLYKQAGNAIVVDVLYYIFKNMLEEKQLELF
ncbi:DNA cytosine methyltransferase [Bacillus phage vB_BthS_BMBphi]|nr:DNA cytosine methyltransferase [Bacillus phage vB_BthS_BMBphi]